MSTQKVAKHNTRKLLMKGKSKKDIKELVVPLVKTPPQGGIVPPFTVFLHMRRNVMVVSVPLHRVPDKIVQFDADAKRFLLDTTKFTRKPFHLEFTYPEGITVDTSSVDAKIENGQFVASLSLLSVPEAFKQKTDGMDVAADKSRKRKRSGAETQQNGGAEAAATTKVTKATPPAAAAAAPAAAQKTKKQPAKKQKKGPSESSEKQIDARAVSLDKAMGLIDELSSKEESQINQKLNKEKEKKAAFNAKEKEKRQKKQDKKQKIDQLVDELKREKDEQEQEKKPLKKATPRRVSFAEPGKKAAAANGAASPAKKPARKAAPQKKKKTAAQ
ncbi:uncharacterized protein ACA1_362100 [Acanthamoeba castellanii str. Neff]|uniref:Uncharacterized protein n=1 Tax=Acanthamoeba castellanii (strain ATCC 30010 / Neff) TaxID=1257118 RepID=L8GG85_ACACF|nr:uncharacterized protein ACA1_362100 [Acanthamoeba castellanii str. Neff]ELR11748.1 hypothetical protein ACA1_362100 [Acanthamoeba castellanii str. Neff]